MMWIEDLIMTTLRDQWRNKERRQNFCDRLFFRGLDLCCLPGEVRMVDNDMVMRGVVSDPSVAFHQISLHGCMGNKF